MLDTLWSAICSFMSRRGSSAESIPLPSVTLRFLALALSPWPTYTGSVSLRCDNFGGRQEGVRFGLTLLAFLRTCQSLVLNRLAVRPWIFYEGIEINSMSPGFKAHGNTLV
jgi:hypothetical protein